MQVCRPEASILSNIIIDENVTALIGYGNYSYLIEP